MTAQDKDRIECAIRHIQTAVDVDPWAVEIAVEAMKTQLSAEGTTSDLISRQDAIDVLGVFTQADALGHTPKQIVEALPSAQPKIEERKEESAQNVPKEDLVSRKAAIDALLEIRQKEISDGRRFHDYCSLSTAVDVIKDLPSAQPEIVHCRDCMHYGSYYRGNESKPVITHLCKWCLDRTMEPDDYCSHAERRTDA